MKRAEIVPVPAGHAHGYTWKWRCIDSKTVSKTDFALYYDCVTDARKHGFEVELQQAHGLTAPGGARQNLE